MKRRDFVKLFAVTPAVAAASKVLADIKEAEEPLSKVIKNPLVDREDTFVAKHIVHFSLEGENNLLLQSSSIGPFATQGLHKVRITAGIELWDSQEFSKLSSVYCKYISFEYGNLSGRRFIISDFSIDIENEKFMSATVNALEVYVDSDQLVLT